MVCNITRVIEATDMNNKEQLYKLLNEEGLRIMGIFPGTDPNVTSDKVALHIRESLEALKNGNFTDLMEVVDSD